MRSVQIVLVSAAIAMGIPSLSTAQSAADADRAQEEESVTTDEDAPVDFDTIEDDDDFSTLEDFSDEVIDDFDEPPSQAIDEEMPAKPRAPGSGAVTDPDGSSAAASGRAESEQLPTERSANGDGAKSSATDATSGRSFDGQPPDRASLGGPVSDRPGRSTNGTVSGVSRRTPAGRSSDGDASGRASTDAANDGRPAAGASSVALRTGSAGTPPTAPPSTTAPPGGIEVPERVVRPRPLNLKPPAKPVAVVTEDQLRTQLEKMVAAYRTGDTEQFMIERAELENMRERSGVANVVLASAVLMRQAQAALTINDHERALDLTSSAIRLSPDLVAARGMQLKVLWARDWTQLRAVVGALGSLLGAQFGAFRNQVSVLTSASVVLGLATLLTILAFAFVQLVKYVRYPAHDLLRWLPRFAGPQEMTFILVLAVILPVAFGFGPAASVLVAFVVVAGYQSASERWLSRLMMGALALVPVVLYTVAPLITFHGSLVDAMATATSQAFAGDAETRLEAASAGQRDATSAMILARRKRLRGDLAGADLAYERALIIRPGDPVGLNNRGVIQFMLGRPEAAASLFSKGVASNRPEPILNLATIRAEQGQFEEATQLLERARGIDGQLAARYTGAVGDGSDAAQHFFEADINSGALWARLFSVDRNDWYRVAEGLWLRVGGYAPLWSMTLMALLALGLSTFIALRSDRLSIGCPKCGTPADRDAYGQLCEQCTSVFLTAVAVEPRLRAQKERQVRLYQRRRRATERIASLLAGLGHFFAGRPGAGLLLFFLFAVALVARAFRSGVLVHDWQVGYEGAGSGMIGTVAILVALVLCAISVRQSLER